jgi:molybdopterin molybdotransferase
MRTVEEALAEVLAHAAPLVARTIGLEGALGCVLADDVRSDIDLPPFDKALVDGYAVRAADVLAGGDRGALRLGEEIVAGRVPTRPLGPREAAAVMTGAPLPDGADAVVMIERTASDGQSVSIDAAERVVVGMNRLTRGRELRAGDVVLRAGVRLNPARVGLLAAVGGTAVRVVPGPTVSIVPTGDELVEPHETPAPGQIRNSNAPLLRALVMAHGCSVSTQPIARDDLCPLRSAIEAGLAADVLIVTGGVSAGRRDLVPEVLAQLGVEPVFHKVRLKPGKPLFFGRAQLEGGRRPLVFGLPGNPVSCVVGFLLFVRPALDALAGMRPRQSLSLDPVTLASAFVHRGDRPTFHPVRREGNIVRPLDWAGSADLRTVAAADGFAHFPAGDRAYEPGESVGFLPLS